jgi:hypothetical protein
MSSLSWFIARHMDAPEHRTRRRDDEDNGDRAQADPNQLPKRQPRCCFFIADNLPLTLARRSYARPRGRRRHSRHNKRRNCYDRKRAEVKHHRRAFPALARRRLDVFGSCCATRSHTKRQPPQRLTNQRSASPRHRTRSKLGTEPLDETDQPRMVRPGPVDPPAFGAATEFVIVATG